MIKIAMVLCMFLSIQPEAPDSLFTEGKQWTYLARTTSNGNISQIDTVILKVEEGNFFISQQKISWSLTRSTPDGGKVGTMEITGVVENDERIWIHPPRLDYLKFTELAAFPEVRFPIEKNTTWESSTSIGRGWGKWENHTVSSKYTIIGKVPSELDSTDCLQVEAVSNSDFGTYITTYCFDEHRGFEYIKYIRPGKSETEIKLLGIEEI